MNNSSVEAKRRSFAIFMWFFICTVPAILILWYGEVLGSISAYAYKGQLLSALLSISATTLISQGWMVEGRTYNVFFGLLLIGVALTPYKHYPATHYSFAIFFYLLQCASIIVFSNSRHRVYKYAMISIILVMFLLCFVDKKIILFAEWGGIAVFAANNILEELKVTD